MVSKSTGEIKISKKEFLKVFKNRRDNQPVLTRSALIEKLYLKGVTDKKISVHTLDKNLKGYIYDEETNPSGFIMEADIESVNAMYYLKGEKMVKGPRLRIRWE